MYTFFLFANLMFDSDSVLNYSNLIFIYIYLYIFKLNVLNYVHGEQIILYPLVIITKYTNIKMLSICIDFNFNLT